MIIGSRVTPAARASSVVPEGTIGLTFRLTSSNNHDDCRARAILLERSSVKFIGACAARGKIIEN